MLEGNKSNENNFIYSGLRLTKKGLIWLIDHQVVNPPSDDDVSNLLNAIFSGSLPDPLDWTAVYYAEHKGYLLLEPSLAEGRADFKLTDLGVQNL